MDLNISEQIFDISNPRNFSWCGSIIHGFDEEEQKRLISLRKRVHDSISRKKRKDSSRSLLQYHKTQLDILVNQQLHHLDLYNAALKYDYRTLSTETIGIAASVDEATSMKTQNDIKYHIELQNREKELSEVEKKKKAEFDTKINELTKEVESKKAKLSQLEKQSRNLKYQVDQHVKREEQYIQYQNWLSLNKELIELQEKRQYLESGLKFVQPNRQ